MITRKQFAIGFLIGTLSWWGGYERGYSEARTHFLLQERVHEINDGAELPPYKCGEGNLYKSNITREWCKDAVGRDRSSSE